MAEPGGNPDFLVKAAAGIMVASAPSEGGKGKGKEKEATAPPAEETAIEEEEGAVESAYAALPPDPEPILGQSAPGART